MIKKFYEQKAQEKPKPADKVPKINTLVDPFFGVSKNPESEQLVNEIRAEFQATGQPVKTTQAFYRTGR